MCKLKKYLKLKQEGKSSKDAYSIVRDENLNLKKYQNLKQEGKTPIEVYSIAKAEGLNPLSCMRILSNVYHLSPKETKEVMVCADTGAKSLSEYQEKYILPSLKEAFEQEELESKKKGETPPKQ